MPELNQNKIHIDFRNNPEAKDAFAGKKAGDKATVTVQFQVDALNDEGLDGSIEELQVEGYENPHPEEGESGDEIKPDAQAPVMLAIRNVGSGAPDQEPDGE
jgi:hypothetical protein